MQLPSKSRCLTRVFRPPSIASTSSFRDSEFFAEVRQQLQQSDIPDEQKLGLIAATREIIKKLWQSEEES